MTLVGEGAAKAVDSSWISRATIPLAGTEGTPFAKATRFVLTQTEVPGGMLLTAARRRVPALAKPIVV
jgi:hypothetical protein